VPYALVLAALVRLGFEDFDPRYCPSEALGYVRIVKDGIRVSGGDAKYRSQTDILIAWFPADWRSKSVIVTMVMKPGENVRLQTEGRGVVRIRRGAFCVFGPPPGVWREWMPPRPSPSPSR
jgi:hypothetical protein